MLEAVPNEKRKCHRCNFEKSCRQLVLDGDCQRWKKMPWAQHPLTGEKVDEYACIDDHAFAQLIDLQRQVSLGAIETNQLRNEVAKGNAENVSMGAMAVQRATAAVKETFAKTLIDFLPDRSAKLIESGSSSGSSHHESSQLSVSGTL